MTETSNVQEIKNTSDFLFLFEEENGLKFLTHDIKSSGLDFMDYVYLCERKILEEGADRQLPHDIYDLVRGFVFGPSWTDIYGKKHEMFVSSEQWMSYYESTGQHPLNYADFQDDVDAFRHSIRFRNGRFSKIMEELKEYFPELNITIKKNVKGVDFYTDTRHFRYAMTEILSSMNDFKENREIVVSYEEDDESDHDYVICSVILEQKGSFPLHSLEHDMQKMKAGGGTMANIRKSLSGYATWSMVSRWNDSDEPQRWNVLRMDNVPAIEPASEAEGFKHIVSVYQKKRRYDTSD